MLARPSFGRRASMPAALLLLALTALPVAAQDDSTPDPASDAEADVPDLANDEILPALAELVRAHPDLASLMPLGPTQGGHDVNGLLLGPRGDASKPLRGWLVVGGLDGRRPSDATVVMKLAEALLEDEDTLTEVLGDASLVLVPRANPDGAAALLGDLGPVHERIGNGRPDDADRDARTDEDGPTDLDGDGRVTWMRVPDSDGAWVIDEHDPRAMRKPLREEGERGTHRMLIESADADGDGEFGEDGNAGVQPDRNFPHRFVEQDADSGAYPLSEPEAMSLARLMLHAPGLIGVLVIGPQDSFASLPGEEKNPPRGGFRGGFTAPFAGMLGDDLGPMKELKRRFEEALEDSGDKHEVKADALPAGSFVAWAYHQGGRWPLSLKSWAPPEDFPKPDKGDSGESDDADADADADAAGADSGDADAASGMGEALPEAADPGDPAAAPDAEPSEPDAPADDADAAESEEEEDEDKPTSDKDSPVPAAVLAWLDEDHAGEGIVPWAAYEHPDLGPVEIGGLAPGTLHDAPGAVAAEFGTRLAPFMLDLLSTLPALAFEDVEVEDAGGGLFHVSAAVVNTGVLPTHTSFGAASRLQRPIRVRLGLPEGAALLNGPTQVLVDRLGGSGGRREMRWVVSATSGDRLTLSADADTVADVELEVEL